MVKGKIGTAVQRKKGLRTGLINDLEALVNVE